MREFSIIKLRILEYLEYKGFSKYQFYQNTGISNGVLSQKNGLSEENILKFISYFSDISPEWLLTGNGSMLKNSDNIMSSDNNNDVQHNTSKDLFMINELLNRISEQAEEIGRLNAKIEQLQNMLKKIAGNVNTSGTAAAG